VTEWDLSGAVERRVTAAAASLDDFEHELPVPLDVFVQDTRYLGNPPLSAEQYEAVRHAERIYLPETYPILASVDDKAIAGYWAQPCRMVNFLDLEWGKGSGKDHSSRIMNLRVVYLLLCLKSPQQYFQMPEQDTIHTLNVATSSAQAGRAFFAPMRRAVSRPGNWFAHVSEAVEAGGGARRETRALLNLIRFDKNIEAISGHSDADSQEGLNLLFGVADEVDGFKSQAELEKERGARARESASSAEAILNMLRTSAATRFPHTYKNVRISYPRYLGSTIQKLVERAKLDNQVRGARSRYYVSGPKCTWEVNPRITRESLQPDYDDDAALARAKYECRPGRAVNPYFGNEMAIRAACFQVAKDPVTVVDYVRDAGAWAPFYDYADYFLPIRGARYAMHADLSVRGDRAGVAMSHIVRWDERQAIGRGPMGENVYLTEKRPIVKTDFVISYEADAGREPPLEIQLRWFRQLVLDLRTRGFNIVQASADGYQCVSGDVEIPLLDGTTRSMKELEGSSPFWLYSIKDGRIVPGLCTRAWCTGFRTDMVEVELDNGEKLHTTADHLFMLRDGSYREAGQLIPGQSLMPLYRRLRKTSAQSGEYEQVWNPASDTAGRHWRFTHTAVSHYCYGPVPKGSVTHHKNLNERDNSPGNLVQMTNAAHSRLHREMSEGRFRQLWADPEWAAAHKQRLSALRTAEMTGRPRKEGRRYRHDMTFERIRSCAEGILDAGERLSWRAVAARLGCDQVIIYDRVKEAGFASWAEFRWSLCSEEGKTFEQSKFRAAVRNHKVVAVRPSHPEPVYDLQVEEHHNFATAAGVFVHNSTDTAQILQAHGIEFVIRSTDRTEEHWSSLRDVAYEGRWAMPLRELAITELLGLSRLPNGKIDHLGDGSKDEADAIACSISGALEVLGEEDPDGLQAWPAGVMENWGGTPLFNLPIGFVPPSVFRPDEVMPTLVAVDGRGMPMWLPDATEPGSDQCPCRGQDGVARCMECRMAVTPRQQ
jgi:Intein splicing domain/HNH endonuclease